MKGISEGSVIAAASSSRHEYLPGSKLVMMAIRISMLDMYNAFRFGPVSKHSGAMITTVKPS